MKMKNLFAGLVATTIVASSASAFAATYDAENGTVAIGADLSSYAGQQVTVLLVPADENGAVPTAIDDDMILYIDQTAAAAGIFQNMGVKGGALEAGKTYFVRIGGENLAEGIIEEKLEIAAESTGVQITLNYGDVNGDAAVGSGDASLILQKGVGLIAGFTDQEGRAIPETIGDVNGDAAVGSGDASLILQKGVGLIAGFTDQEGNPLTTYTYTYVEE